MSDVLVVRLHGRDVGEIVRFDNGRTQFEFYPQYTAQRDRPTLSQSFLDDHGNVIGGGRHTISGEAPVFFSNLLPEGRLRTYLAAKAGVRETREFELLELLGHDLPGAVGVVREDHVDDPRHTPTSPKYWDDSPDVLRFSLAGVQLKFSAIETAAGGLTIPPRGMGGDWILKLPSVHYDAVPENEYSMMTLAREVGIEVPETRLVPMGRVEGLPPEAVDGRIADMNALAVRRYDRTGDGRIHAEDFAQVIGLRPIDKYEHHSYASIALLLAALSKRSGGQRVLQATDVRRTGRQRRLAHEELVADLPGWQNPGTIARLRSSMYDGPYTQRRHGAATGSGHTVEGPNPRRLRRRRRSRPRRSRHLREYGGRDGREVQGHLAAGVQVAAHPRHRDIRRRNPTGDRPRDQGVSAPTQPARQRHATRPASGPTEEREARLIPILRKPSAPARAGGCCGRGR